VCSIGERADEEYRLAREKEIDEAALEDLTALEYARQTAYDGAYSIEEEPEGTIAFDDPHHDCEQCTGISDYDWSTSECSVCGAAYPNQDGAQWCEGQHLAEFQEALAQDHEVCDRDPCDRDPTG
jgi:hypothetical protein